MMAFVTSYTISCPAVCNHADLLNSTKVVPSCFQKNEEGTRCGSVAQNGNSLRVHCASGGSSPSPLAGACYGSPEIFPNQRGSSDRDGKRCDGRCSNAQSRLPFNGRALWACAPLQASFGASSRFLAHIKAKKARRLQNSALAEYQRINCG